MKGGVGKTAAVVNLAYLAAKGGARTIICDLDPQGASSYYFRIKASRNFNTNKFIKGGRNIDKNIKGTDYANLDLLPSKLSYRNLDIALDSLKNSKTRLRRIFKLLKHEYDYLFLDCPPGISLVSENVFDASDLILVPLIPTTLSVLTFERLRKFLKKNGTAAGKLYTFFSMVERRKNLHREMIKKITAEEKHVLRTRILYRSEIERMGIERAPVAAAHPNAPSAEAYTELWDEIKSVIP